MILNNLDKIIKTVVNINRLALTSIKPLPKKIIHSNPIYVGNMENGLEKIYIKLFKSEKILKKEMGCNNYLKCQDILVSKIISYGSKPIPYIITGEIRGKPLSKAEMKMRINDLAKIHIYSLINGTKKLKAFLSKKTISDRLVALKHNQQILYKYLSISNKEKQMIKKLQVILSKEKLTVWDDCFCFNDFFINNSLVSPEGIYYYDFEKTCICSPFLDVGCVILDFFEAYQNIKLTYIKKIRQIINDKKTVVNLDCVDYMIDLSACEKALEDAAFLVDNSIKKTASIAYCKKLARNDLSKFTKIFNNLDINNK